MMKKYRIFFAAFMFIGFLQYSMVAQCINSVLYPTQNSLAPASALEPTIVSTFSYPGDYFIVEQLETGKNYQFTSSVETDYLSIYDQNENIVSHGIQPLSILATASMDSIFVHLNLDASCGQSYDFRTPKIFCLDCPAPGVGIGVDDPHNSAILDIQSGSQGVLLPRMTEVQRDNIIGPAEGLLIYNQDTRDLNWYDAISDSWFDPVSDEDLVPIIDQIGINANQIIELGNDSVTLTKDISYHAFSPPQNSIEMYTNTTTGKWVTSGSILYAPLQIPENSVVKKISLFYYDNSNTDGLLSLSKSHLSSSSTPEQVEYLNTSGSSTSVGEVSKLMNYVIENDYAYSFSFQNYNDSNVRIKGARIEYRIRVYNE